MRDGCRVGLETVGAMMNAFSGFLSAAGQENSPLEAGGDMTDSMGSSLGSPPEHPHPSGGIESYQDAGNA